MEVDIGVELPAKAMRMMIAAAGPGAAAEVLLAGNSLTPERALAVGLASEIAPDAEVLGRALNRCQALAAKPRGAFASIKRSLQEAAGISQSKSDRDTLDHFLDQWFSPESIGARRRLAESLRG
jgi:enoyl-CoA hydratase